MSTKLETLRSRILVIDDNPAIHEDFQKILVSTREESGLADAAFAFLGPEVVENTPTIDVELDSALQGEEGYEKVQNALKEGRPYTLAFCDMRMPPGWDGLETIENLFEADPKLQVVICSAYSDNTWEDITERLGQSDRLLILKKPFDNAEVLQIAVALTEKRRLIDAASLKREELERIVEERTLKLNEARLESERLLTAIDSIMIRTDGNGTVKRWNDRAVKIFGLEADAVVGVKFEELPINWDDSSALTNLLSESHDLSSKRMELRFSDAQGNTRVVGFSSYQIQDDGDAKGVLVLGADLTEHRILEQQLHNAQKLESVGQLAAGVAHEINTPMQYIGDNLHYVETKFGKLIDYLQGTVELLALADEREFESDKVTELQEIEGKLKLSRLVKQIPEALSDSIEGVEHVSRIVRAMKELSHPGGEEKVPVDINRALETTMTVSTNEWKYVADMETELEPDLGSIYGFPGELNQVFLNLIVNAAHAISEITEGGEKGRGKITLRSMKRNDVARIEISDTGGGIPASIREKVFDPFFTTKPVGKGTGQGLAIAHSVIVQKHGGQLSFDVEEGVGTTFAIEIPFADGTPELSRESAESMNTAN